MDNGIEALQIGWYHIANIFMDTRDSKKIAMKIAAGKKFGIEPNDLVTSLN
jgi:hypothetical protein